MFQKNIIIDNLKINYYQSENFNSLSPVVYLHGWGSEAMHFKNILADCPNFIAPDLPGFGGSEMIKEAWTVKNYADFLKKFLAKLEIKNPILAGHSFGGSIIIKYCALGNTVKKIILISSAGIKQSFLIRNIYKFLPAVGKLFFLLPLPEFLKVKIRKIHKVIDTEKFSNLTAGTLKKTFKYFIEEDLRADLKKVSCKAVLIWGRGDLTIPVKTGLLINKLIKNSKIHIIQNAGHYPFADKEKEFSDMFINEINAE